MGNPPREILAFQSINHTKELEILAARNVRVDTQRIGHQADEPCGKRWFARDVMARDRHAATFRTQKPRNKFQERGLARAVRADKTEDFALTNSKRQILHGLDAVGVVLIDPLDI